MPLSRRSDMSILSRFRSCLCGPGMKSHQPGSRANLGLERLDDRIVPAGNVTGTVLDGTLTLIGDPQSNNIEISGFQGNIRVTGQGGTTVNGAASADFSGAYQDVVV